MKLLKTDYNIKELKSKMDVILEEHDNYSFETAKEAYIWVNSLPISTLNESLLFENKGKTNKLSLLDFTKKKILKKEYEDLKLKMEILLSNSNENDIDLLIYKIKKIQ